MTQIHVGKAGSFGISSTVFDSMLRVRHHAFYERLRWDVQVCDGRERDLYDALDATYIVATDEARQRCLGCVRLLPSTGPNMLRDIFSPLLAYEYVVASHDVWEVSRFAIAPDVPRSGMRFSPVPADILRAMMRFARANGIKRLVGATTTAIDRMMRGFGFDVERLSVERRIGTARTIAFSLPVTDAVLARVGVEEQRHSA